MDQYPDETQSFSIGSGKAADFAYLIEPNVKYLIFNVTRSGMEYFPYVLAEAIKDRKVFSSKYKPVNKYLRFDVHVIVMCNEHPDESKLSEDRYNIRKWTCQQPLDTFV